MSDAPPNREMERVAWFKDLDYYILEFYDDHDICISPSDMAANLEYEQSYVGKRLRKLRDAGLLTQRDDSRYELSEFGKEFLSGSIDGSAVDEP